MEAALAAVTLDARTGDPKDNVVNTFAFDMFTNLDPAVAGQDIVWNLETFYNAAYPTHGIGWWLSEGISRLFGSAHVKVFDLTGHLDGSPHGSAVFESEFDLDETPGSSTPIPEEVALAVTLIGTGRATAPVEAPDGSDPGTKVDRPKQRRTGRIYLGPFNANALAAQDANGNSRPSSALISTVMAACEQLRTDSTAQGMAWSVWSRANAAMYAIQGARIDNSWDTQRRRGTSPTVTVVEAWP